MNFTYEFEYSELIGRFLNNARSHVALLALHPHPTAGNDLVEVIVRTRDQYIRSRGTWWLEQRQNFDVV